MTIKGKALGIDYGDKRIGIAVSDNELLIAFGREYILNTSKREVIQKIKAICEQDEITLIVIGLPLNMEGDDTRQTKKVRMFASELRRAVNADIVLHDERLTTIRSNVILTSIGKREPAKREEKDIIAASLILQNYLDLLGKSKGERKRG